MCHIYDEAHVAYVLHIGELIIILLFKFKSRLTVDAIAVPIRAFHLRVLVAVALVVRFFQFQPIYQLYLRGINRIKCELRK